MGWMELPPRGTRTTEPSVNFFSSYTQSIANTGLLFARKIIAKTNYRIISFKNVSLYNFQFCKNVFPGQLFHA
jgi:hypothetical protein